MLLGTTLLGLLALGCSSTAREPAPDPAAVTEPRFGGALLTLHGHRLELVVHASGEVHLHLHEGEDLSEAGASVTLPTAEEPRAVALRWADDVQGFTGELESVEPSTGDATVLLIHRGRRLEGSVPVESLVPPPEHDGSVVHVGAHDVEVTVDPDGRASAWVLDDPDHRLDLDLTLDLPGADGQMHPLGLAWDPELARYAGTLEGLRARPGPLELIAREGGEEHLGRGSLLGVEPPPPAGGGVPADLRLEMPELGSDLPAVIPIPPPSSSASSSSSSGGAPPAPSAPRRGAPDPAEGAGGAPGSP